MNLPNDEQMLPASKHNEWTFLWCNKLVKCISKVLLIDAEWRIYASANKAIFNSDDVYRLFDTKPLSKSILVYCQLDF